MYFLKTGTDDINFSLCGKGSKIKGSKMSDICQTQKHYQ